MVQQNAHCICQAKHTSKTAHVCAWHVKRTSPATLIHTFCTRPLHTEFHPHNRRLRTLSLQTAIHINENPSLPLRHLGKNLKRKKKLPAHRKSDACEKSAASQNRQNDGNPFVHWCGRWFHEFVPTLVAANVHQDQVSIL